LALFAPDLAEQIMPMSWSFLDKEHFVDLIDPDRREADLLIQVQFMQQATRAKHRSDHLTILIHLEHQAQEDPHLDRRMFHYFARFYDRYGHAIAPIALCSYHSPRRQAPQQHQVQIGDRQIINFQYQVVQLNHLDWRNFVQVANPVAAALMARMQVKSQDYWRVKAACLRLIAGLNLNSYQQRFISQFVDIYLPLNTSQTQLFQQEVASFQPHEQEVIMTNITSWEQKGRAEGRVEGRVEGQREIVTYLLTRIIGPLPEPITHQIALLSPIQLTNLADQLLGNITSLEQLQLWLDNHTHT
jgi:predicted transposase YdaD